MVISGVRFLSESVTSAKIAATAIVAADIQSTSVVGGDVSTASFMKTGRLNTLATDTATACRFNVNMSAIPYVFTQIWGAGAASTSISVNNASTAGATFCASRGCTADWFAIVPLGG